MGVAFSAIGGGLFGYLTGNVLFGAVFGASSMFGYVMGYFITPDLDQVGMTSDEGRLMEAFGILGVLIVMIFLPYAFIMRFVGFGKKGHRNFFSHTPWISTLIRLVWLYFPFYRIWASYFPETHITIWHSFIFFGQWWGLGFADLVHWILDFTPRGKKKNGIRNKKRNPVAAHRKHRR